MANGTTRLDRGGMVMKSALVLGACVSYYMTEKTKNIIINILNN